MKVEEETIQIQLKKCAEAVWEGSLVVGCL